MAVSNRVRADVDASFHGRYLIKRVRKHFRVYEDASGYSSTSGGYTALGKVMRDADDKPVQFDTEAQAISWIDGGCIIWPEIQFAGRTA